MQLLQHHRPWYGKVSAGRIIPSGFYFVDVTGQIVIRRSITAFAAAKRVQEGRLSDLQAYLDWVKQKDFNEIRCFTRVNWTGPPGIGVETGWAYDRAACEVVTSEAASRGLRVEWVVHTYGTTAVEMAAHLREVDGFCLAHENTLLEVCNEPGQNGGIDLLAATLRIYSPAMPGWASGATPPDAAPTGQSLTHHSDRKPEWPRCFKDAFEFGTGQGPKAEFSPGFPGPVMLDEPPQVEQTCRDYSSTAVADWEAYGAGAAAFAAGGTMHGNPSMQRCEVPTDPLVLACVDAFIAGFKAVPLQRYHGYFHPDDRGSLRRYWRWGADGKKYEISVRPFEFREA